MSATELTPLSGKVKSESIKHPGVRAIINSAFLSEREDRLSVYFNLAVFNHAQDEDAKRFIAALVKKITNKDLPVVFGGRKQPLMTVVSQAETDVSQITRMSIQSSRLEWDFENGVRVLVDKDMINFVSQAHVQEEINNALRVHIGPDTPIKYNF